MSKENVFDFMGKRYIAAVFSIVLLVGSVVSLAINGLNFGLDFTGGTLVELHYPQTANLESIRSQIKEGGYPNASVVNFGSDKDVLVRVQTDNPKLGDEIAQYLGEKSGQNVQRKRVEYVGPQVGEELRDMGGIGMLIALVVVLIYVAVRFQIKFSIGAVAALAHDVVIVLGFFSLLQLDFDLTVLAAVLAVIGYSLNDTIVVSDRIRENFRILRKGTAIEIINISLSQTLGRTLITSLTTLLVLVVLSVFGGEMIHNFASALITGVVIGTYSSVYVAANVLLLMKITKEDLIQPEIEKEGADQEALM